MIDNFKTLIISIAFALSLLIAGCSSTTTDAVNEQEMDSQGATSSAPSAAEERIYREDAKEAFEKKEAEKLKKRKSSDDDMERLD